jgi:hypothetical protein
MFLPSETAASSEWRVASSERRITVGDWCLMPHSALSTPHPILAYREVRPPEKISGLGEGGYRRAEKRLSA